MGIAQLLKSLIEKMKQGTQKAASGAVGVPLSVDNTALAPLAQPFSGASLAHRDERAMLQEGGLGIEAEMGALMPEEAPIPLEMPEEELEIPQETQETILPDGEMEEDYLDFVISEALEPEEEQYLLNRLDEDDQLSEIFDKVVETASEFSGSGSVEGPGSTVSDSIPARLSDGEFVMTSKATDAIGADTLEELMALAEQEADGAQRQTAQAGGLAKAEGSAIIAGVSEDERGIAVKNKEAMRLLDPRLSLFAS